MAYQTPTTPRFIIDYISWWKSLGLLYPHELWNASYTGEGQTNERDVIRKIIGLDPTVQGMVDSLHTSYGVNNGYNYFIGCRKNLNVMDTNIVGVLGHNIASAAGLDCNFTFTWKIEDDSPDGYGYPSMEAGESDLGDNIMINCVDGDAAGDIKPTCDGFFLRSVNNSNNTYPVIANNGLQPNIRDIDISLGAGDGVDTTLFTPIKVGSLLWGRYYDLDHSVDLNLSMERHLDGVTKTRTLGGSDLVKHNYTKGPMWGDLAPWEIVTPGFEKLNQKLSRQGRRSWDLSFSYMKNSDIAPKYDSLNRLSDNSLSETEVELTNKETLWDSNDFYTQVIAKTQGGLLPFLFMPNKDDFNIDSIAIAKFDMNTFRFEQTSAGFNKISVRIREVW